jgi:hypothetical protein
LQDKARRSISKFINFIGSVALGQTVQTIAMNRDIDIVGTLHLGLQSIQFTFVRLMMISGAGGRSLYRVEGWVVLDYTLLCLTARQ